MCNIFHCKSCHHLKVYGRPLFFPCLTQTSYNYFYITALEKINAKGAPVVQWIALFRQSNAIIARLMSIASFIIATHGKRVSDTTQTTMWKEILYIVVRRNTSDITYAYKTKAVVSGNGHAKDTCE